MVTVIDMHCYSYNIRILAHEIFNVLSVLYSLSKYNKHFHNTKILLPHTQRLRVDIFFLLRSFLTMKMLKNCTLHSNEELLLIAKTTHMFPLQTNGNGVFYDITSYTFSKILMLIREFFLFFILSMNTGNNNCQNV